MKAIVREVYGKADVLSYQEVEKPTPKENEVLVKIHASSINSWDWDLLIGIPRIYRLLFGIFKPRHKIIGIDIAGTVEAVGSKVKNLKVGDEVFGDISDSGFGAFAEYVCTKENLLAIKPKTMSFEHAATLPHGGVLALQSVEYNGEIKSGQKVLINGAGGSTGPFALQMLKHYGAEVTCVDSASKLEMLSSLGADHVIDYKKENYTKTGKQYDLVIDLIADQGVSDFKKVIMPGGAFTIVGGKVSSILSVAFLSSILTRKKMGLLGHKPCKENLERLVGLYEKGILQPIIDKTFALKGLPEAITYFASGLAKGKILITM